MGSTAMLRSSLWLLAWAVWWNLLVGRQGKTCNWNEDAEHHVIDNETEEGARARGA